MGKSSRKRRKRRRKAKKGRFAPLFAFLLGVFLTVGVVYFFVQEKTPSPSENLPEKRPAPPPLISEQRDEIGISKKDIPPHPSSPSSSLALHAKPKHRPRIAIVIDDLGGENHLSQELLDRNFPLTLSILPFSPYSKGLAMEAHRRGREVLLHLPMEPHGYPRTKPGEGALFQQMDTERMLQQLSDDIAAVPYIKGVSNHMGSLLTEDPVKMRTILSELKRRDLFFLDNLTTPQSVGVETARSIGLKATGRTLFLDHSSGEDEVRQNLERLTQLAFAHGRAIGIGHPHAPTIKSLKEMIPKIKQKGIEIVPVSQLME